MFLECGTALAKTKPCSVVIYRLADEKKPEARNKKYQLSFKLANDYLRLCGKSRTENCPVVVSSDSAHNTQRNAAVESSFMKQSKRNRAMPSAIENGVNNTDCSNNTFSQNDKDSRTSMENGHLWKKAFLEDRPQKSAPPTPPSLQAKVAAQSETKEEKIKETKGTVIESSTPKEAATIKVNIKTVLKNNANTPKDISPENINKTSDLKQGMKTGNGLNKFRDGPKSTYLINTRSERKRELISSPQPKIFKCKRTLSSLKRKWSYGAETHRKRLLEPQYEIAKSKDDDATKNSTRIILKTRKTSSSAAPAPATATSTTPTTKPKIEKVRIHNSNITPEIKVKKVSPLTVYAKVEDNKVTEVSCKRYRKRNKRKAKSTPMVAKEIPVDFNVLYSVLPRHESVAQSVRETMDFLIKEVLRKSVYSDDNISFNTVSNELKDLVYEFCVENDYVYDDFRNLENLLTFKVVDSSNEQINPELNVKRRRRILLSPVDSEEDDNYELLTALIRSRQSSRTSNKIASTDSNPKFDELSKDDPYSFSEEHSSNGGKLRLSSSDSDTLPANNTDAESSSEINFCTVKEEIEDIGSSAIDDNRDEQDEHDHFESDIFFPMAESNPDKDCGNAFYSDNDQSVSKFNTVEEIVHELETSLPQAAANLARNIEPKATIVDQNEDEEKEFLLSNLDLNCDVSDDSDTDNLVICFDASVSESNANNADKSESLSDLSYKVNDNFLKDDFDAQNDSFSQTSRTAKSEVPKLVTSLASSPEHSQSDQVSNTNGDIPKNNNNIASSLVTENSMPLLKDLIKPLEAEISVILPVEKPIQISVEKLTQTPITKLEEISNEIQQNSYEAMEIDETKDAVSVNTNHEVDVVEITLTTTNNSEINNSIASEGPTTGTDISTSNGDKEKRSSVDDSILRTLLQESPPEDFNIFLEQTANSMSLFDDDPKPKETAKESIPVESCGDISTDNQIEIINEINNKEPIVIKETSVSPNDLDKKIVLNNEDKNSPLEEKTKTNDNRSDSPEIVELSEISPETIKKKKIHDFGDNYSNMTLEEMIKVLEKDIENLEKMSMEKQKELLLINKYKAYKENLLKSLIKSRRKPYVVPTNLPFPVISHASPNNKMSRSISNGELNKCLEQKDTVMSEKPSTPTKLKEDQIMSANNQKETCLVRPLVREAKTAENVNAGSFARADRNILETRKSIPILNAITPVNILPKPIYPTSSLHQPLPLPIQIAITSRSGFPNPSAIPVLHPSSSHRPEKSQMKSANGNVHRMHDPVLRIKENAQRMNEQMINDPVHRMNEATHRMNERFYMFHEVARRLNETSRPINGLSPRPRDPSLRLIDTSPRLIDPTRKFNDPSHRINESPQRENELTQRINDLPQRMNEAPKRMNEAPKRMNEAPQTISHIPQRANEITQKMNGSPHRINETPQRINEPSQRMNEAPQKINEPPQRMNEAVRKSNELGPPHRSNDSALRMNESVHRKNDTAHRINENRTSKIASEGKNSPSPVDSSRRGFQPYNNSSLSTPRVQIKPKLSPEKPPPNRTLPMMLLDTPSSDYPNYGRNTTVPTVPNAFNDVSKQNVFKGLPNKTWSANEPSYPNIPKDKQPVNSPNKVNINPDILKNSFLSRESSLSELAYNLAISLKEAQSCLNNNQQMPVATSSSATSNVKSNATPVKSNIQDSHSLKMQLQNMTGIPYDFYRIPPGQAAIPMWPYVPFMAAPTANIAPFQYPGLDSRPMLPSGWDAKEKSVVPESRPRESVQKNSPNYTALRANPNTHLDLKNMRFRKCMVCNQADAQFICSGCGKDWYCSVECQRENWKSHSRVCSS